MIPNWKEICEKCQDGEIEPKECEYYGEPSGCNSPKYGEHPPDGNTAAIRESLVKLQVRFERNTMAYYERYMKYTGWHWKKKAAEAKKWSEIFAELNDECKKGLAAPPRNCDIYKSREKARKAFEQSLSKGEKETAKHYPMSAMDYFIDWLFEYAKEGGEW